MINIDEPLRTAYYELLNGNVVYNGSTIQVADGFSTSSTWQDHHIIIGEVTEQQDNTLDCFITNVAVNLEIFTKQHNGWSRNIAADIEGQILDLILPNIAYTALLPVGIELHNVTKESARYLPEESDNGNIIRKIITITQTIVHT